MVIVNLADWPCFFIRTAVGLGIGGVVGLTISGAVLIRMDITIGFFELSLW